MKKALFALVFTFIHCICLAQNVSYKKDTIYTDDIPYCAMKSSGSFAKNFKVFSLSGTEILRVVYDVSTSDYTATFMPDLEQCIYHFKSLKLGKDLAASIVDAQLLKADTLDKKAIVFFMKMYGSPLEPAGDRGGINIGKLAGRADHFAQDVNAAFDNSEPKLKERDRSAMIFIHGNEISQDHVTIGRCEDNMKATSQGLSYNYQFYTADGTLIASATVISGTAQITTVKNNKLHQLAVKDSNTMNIQKELVDWLVDRYYL